MNWTNVRAKIGALVAIIFILLMAAVFATYRGTTSPFSAISSTGSAPEKVAVWPGYQRHRPGDRKHFRGLTPCSRQWPAVARISPHREQVPVPGTFAYLVPSFAQTSRSALVMDAV